MNVLCVSVDFTCAFHICRTGDTQNYVPGVQNSQTCATSKPLLLPFVFRIHKSILQ